MIESAAESFDEVTLPTVIIRTLGTQRRGFRGLGGERKVVWESPLNRNLV